MPTLTIAGSISFPLAAEATPPSRSYTASLIYSEKSDDEVKIVGAQADVDLMGNIADAKACYIEAIAGDGELKVNGAAVTIPISVDSGFFIWFNPNGGLTALTVTTTANATFRVYLFS